MTADPRPLPQGDAAFEGRVFEAATTFVGMHFEDNVSFRSARFEGDVSFAGATFHQDARFADCEFASVTFAGARFLGTMSLDSARVTGDLTLDRARFAGEAMLGRVTVGGQLSCVETVFDGDTWFEDAKVAGPALLYEARFGAQFALDRAALGAAARFDGAAFLGRTSFSAVRFTGATSFEQAVFAEPAVLGPIDAPVCADHATFEKRSLITVACDAASFRHAHFRGGVDLRARGTELDLEGADFAAQASLVAGHEDADPVLRSVAHAKLDCVTLSGADVRRCRFTGAHGLERLRLERCTFAATPRSRRWTRRQVLADEQRWRALSGAGSGWDACPVTEEQLEAWGSAAEVATAYRALRKSREDAKDEPGAADFYYGEMEMRRKAARAWSGERLLLTLYWLLAGYALRPSRAFAAFGAVVVCFAALFVSIGFATPGFATKVIAVSESGVPVYAAATDERTALADAVEGLTFSLGTATAILATPERPLTPEGSALRVLLRILGPVLFGLGLLSIRGRVKR